MEDQYDNQDVRPEYDYIILGGGTAGCIVATRLHQACPKATILVLERGQDETQNPDLTFKTQDSVIFRVAYETIPAQIEHSIETTSYQGTIRTDSYELIVPWALGGGPTVSGAFWGRASPSNLNEWASLGLPNWHYNDVLPYFKRTESYIQPYSTAPIDPSRGQHGPIQTLQLNGADPSIQPVIECLEQASGLSWISDYNTPAGQLGIGAMQRNTGHDLDNPVRSTSYTGYLLPQLPSRRLQVLSKSTVTKINWKSTGNDKKRATSVEFLYDNAFYRIKVRREVILSAGALNSPHLLLISGVGPKNELSKFNIKPVINLPGVGKNLMDHMVFSHTFVMNPAAFPNMTDATPPIIEFTMSDPSSGKIDLELAWSVLAPFGPGQPPVMAMYLVGVRNKHRGYVGLKNNDTLYRPFIQYNLATDTSDFNKIIFLFRQVKAWFALLQAKGLALVEIGPYAAISADAPDSDWLPLLLPNVSDWWHPAGTCKMGADSDLMAVVNNRLRLRGTQNVRIADNSVQPIIVSTHPSGTAMAIGERCAEFIHEDADALDYEMQHDGQLVKEPEDVELSGMKQRVHAKLIKMRTGVDEQEDKERKSIIREPLHRTLMLRWMLVFFGLTLFYFYIMHH